MLPEDFVIIKPALFAPSTSLLSMPDVSVSPPDTAPTDSAMRLDTPIFVGGGGSSGSSLLAALLRRHPNIYCPSEIALFNKAEIYKDINTWKHNLPKWLKKGLPTDGYYPYFRTLPVEDVLTHDFLIRAANESRSTREFIDAIQRFCLEKSNRQLFAEKTPSNSYCFRQIAEIYPNCILIHPVRDGRDVVCSLMKRGFSNFAAASSWLYNTVCAYACRDMPNYFEYKYEDLVVDPAAVMRRLCERASIPFDPQMLEPQQEEKNWNYPLSGVWSTDPSKPISAKSVGRYKTDLSRDDYAVFCHVRLTEGSAKRAGTTTMSALELLEALGYDAEPAPPPPSMVRAKLLESRDFIRRANRFLIRRHFPQPLLTRIG
jgi:protein-tyrosine sulfotransferase